VAEVVLDASVLIAIFKEERFSAAILDVIEGAVMSAANLGEVLSKASDFGMAGSPRVSDLLALLDRIEPFTETQARVSGALRVQTKSLGLSLGDRACLALAVELGADIYTADQAWSQLDLTCTIHLIR
jgi:ribonuclease VapC